MEDVIYAPEIMDVLISVSKAIKNGSEIVGNEDPVMKNEVFFGWNTGTLL